MRGMILAAGLGTRFRPYTEKTAKPAIPFLNVPLGCYGLYYLEQLGLKQLVVNLHHLPDTVREVFNEAADGQAYQLSYSSEIDKILGSGGGVFKARHQLFGNFLDKELNTEALIINGDEVVLFDHDRGLEPLLEAHRSHGALATLLTTNHPGMGTEVGGAWTVDGHIKSFGKDSPSDRARGEHFVGIYVIDSRLMEFFPEGESHIFYDVLMKAIEAGEVVRTYHDPNIKWFETGNVGSYNAAADECFTLLQSSSNYSNTLRGVLSRFGVDLAQLKSAPKLS